MKASLQKRDKQTLALQKRRWRRRLRSSTLAKDRARFAAWEREQGYTQLNCPFALNISSKNNRKHTLRFFRRFRRCAIVDRSPLTIDLSELTYMLPGAAILLIAEFDRARHILGDEFRVRLIKSRSSRINEVLDQIGFSALCGTKLGDQAEDEASDELVKHWRFATGTRINDQTERAFVDIQGRLAPALQEGMWVGISEAIGNSALHAYLEPRGTDGARMATKRWWMLSQVRDGVLSVTVADLGIGIPRSLPLKWNNGVLTKILDGITGKGPDERAIRAALQVGSSSTGDRHRGNGLPQIWEKVRQENRATIAIYSNKGALYWNGARNIESSQEFEGSIYGTVISWTIPVYENKDGQ